MPVVSDAVTIMNSTSPFVVRPSSGTYLESVSCRVCCRAGGYWGRWSRIGRLADCHQLSCRAAGGSIPVSAYSMSRSEYRLVRGPVRPCHVTRWCPITDGRLGQDQHSRLGYFAYSTFFLGISINARPPLTCSYSREECSYSQANIVVAARCGLTGHMNTNRGGYQAAKTKRIETWEHLRERLFRLAELGDELATVVAGPVATWLYREIETEAARVAEVAGAYVDECERWDRAPLGGGDFPAWLDTQAVGGAPGRRVVRGERQ